MTPVFTVMLNVLFLKKSYSGMVYTSLIPVSNIKKKGGGKEEEEEEKENERKDTEYMQ